MNMSKRKLKPILDGDYWLIGGNPEIGSLTGRDDLTGELIQECVDHHVFKSRDGKWNLWGCIRGCTTGRILYHWQSDNLTDRDWKKIGEFIRPDKNYGESINDWRGQEWIQSPYVIEENGKYYMFFGGHATGLDYNGDSITKYGNDHSMLYANSMCQICLMISDDGINWTRYKNKDGNSCIFESQGEVRDPNLIKINGVWHLYHAGNHQQNGVTVPGIYLRTSCDLLSWSDFTIVHSDINKRFGGGYWNQECPHVVEKCGYYYLFITENYASGRTHVFRSDNPTEFGVGDSISMNYYVGTIYAAAPEIIADENGNEYITSNHYLRGGTMLCRLKWIEG